MLTVDKVANECAGIFRNSLDTMQSLIKNSYATGWHLDEKTAEKIANGALKVAKETVKKTIKDHKKDLKNGFTLMIEDITSGREPSPELVARTLESMSDEVISAVRTYAGNEAKNYKPQSVAWFWCHFMEYAAETSFSDVLYFNLLSLRGSLNTLLSSTCINIKRDLKKIDKLGEK